jgi:hypothetical protein
VSTTGNVNHDAKGALASGGWTFPLATLVAAAG